MKPVTIGMLRQALAECPRLKPFSPNAIAAISGPHPTEKEPPMASHA